MEAKTTYWLEVEVKHAGPLDFNELAIVLENQLNGTPFEFVRVTGATCNPDAGKIAVIALANGYVKASDIDALARSAGYVKLEPGQVVVDAKSIIEHCEACDEEGLAVVCDGCVLKPIRDRIKEASDE